MQESELMNIYGAVKLVKSALHVSAYKFYVDTVVMKQTFASSSLWLMLRHFSKQNLTQRGRGPWEGLRKRVPNI